MVLMPTLETPRLFLTPLTLADAPRTQEIFPHGEIVRFLAAHVPWPYPSNGAERYYREDVLPAMERGDEWHWAIRLKDSPTQHIGVIALFRQGDNNRGLWLGLPWHRRGLMTEAVIATNAFWFGTLRVSILRATKAVANVGSRRISVKTGMRAIATTEKDYVSGRLATEVWEITAAEWQQFRNQDESCSFQKT